MNKQMPFVSAVIVAAGSGTRMGGISKPLIKLGEKTLIEHVTDTFSSCKSIDEIIIVCRDDDDYTMLLKTNKPLRYVHGGKNRIDSVANGVKAAEKAEIVCIHDCARPFITVEDIEALISEAMIHGSSCASNKVKDTVKYRDENEKCFYTPNRDKLISVQTPQVFKKSIWYVSYIKALADKLKTTDDTTMVENAGYKVSYVETSTLNIKLTEPNDVKIAKAIYFLRERGSI